MSTAKPAKLPIQPFNDTLYVRKIKTNTTAGGIALPDSVVDKNSRTVASQGVVVAVGPGAVIDHITDTPDAVTKGAVAIREVPPVKVGDVVLFSSQAGLDIEETLRPLLKERNLPDELLKDVIMLRFHDLICRVTDA